MACLLIGYDIAEQSWLFLFNVESGVHLWLAKQQQTGVDIDCNTDDLLLLFLKKKFFSL